MPKEKRVLGYFALPVLVGDEIVAALDLKTDRAKGKLLMQKWTWVGSGAPRRHKRRDRRGAAPVRAVSARVMIEGCPLPRNAVGPQPAMPNSSPLFSPIFASAAVGEIFSDRALVQAMLDFEAALAAAEAEVGIIPATAVAPIRSACDAGLYDIAEIGKAAALAGNVAIPLVKALTAKVNEKARGYVHWGATSQDVIDTGFALCGKTRDRDHARRSRRVDAGARSADRQASRHGHGRPHADAAGAADHLRLQGGGLALRPDGRGRAAAARRGGRARAAVRRRSRNARGTRRGRREGAQARLPRSSDLTEAAITWHAERGRIFDIAAALAGLSGAATKIATDVLLLMQTEVGEAFEPAAPGKGGSSTLPHKRNPVGAAAIRANHRRIAGMMATITMALEQEHERARRRLGGGMGDAARALRAFRRQPRAAARNALQAWRSIRRGCAPTSMRRSACRSRRA